MVKQTEIRLISVILFLERILLEVPLGFSVFSPCVHVDVTKGGMNQPGIFVQSV